MREQCSGGNRPWQLATGIGCEAQAQHTHTKHMIKFEFRQLRTFCVREQWPQQQRKMEKKKIWKFRNSPVANYAFRLKKRRRRGFRFKHLVFRRCIWHLWHLDYGFYVIVLSRTTAYPHTIAHYYLICDGKRNDFACPMGPLIHTSDFIKSKLTMRYGTRGENITHTNSKKKTRKLQAIVKRGWSSRTVKETKSHRAACLTHCLLFSLIK